MMGEAASGIRTTENLTMERNTCDVLSRSKSVSTFHLHLFCKACIYNVSRFLEFNAVVLQLGLGKPLVNF